MKIQHSRRKFLQSSALLTLSSLCITPALAFVSHEDAVKEALPIASNTQNPPSNLPSQTRADIRSIDFDSHNFLLNYR